MSRTTHRRYTYLSNLRRVPAKYKINRGSSVVKAHINLLNQTKAADQQAATECTSRLNVTDAEVDTQETGSSLSDYIIERQLGQGAYAVVQLARSRASGEKVAIKTYEKFRLLEPSRKKSVQREIRILKLLDHPAIPKLVDTIDTTKQLHLVQEVAPGISLYAYMKKFPKRRIPENACQIIFRQIVEVVEYCHSKQVTHRDLKLDNILIHGGKTIRIIDFGFSTVFPNTKKLKLCCGTPSFMAPEIVRRQAEFHGPPVDVWALGVVLYAILAGTYPFRGHSDRELYQKILAGSPAYPACISTPAVGLLKRMLSLDPGQRPSAREILSDPWFTHTPYSPSCTPKHAETVENKENRGDCNSNTNAEQTPHVDSREFDQKAVADIVNLGYNREEVCAAIQNDRSHISRLYRKLRRDRR